MSEFPENWTEAKLGDICSKPQYGWTTKAVKNGSLKLLRTTDISDGKIDWDSVPYCEKKPDDVKKYRVKENDILVSRAGSVGVSISINEVPADAVFASYLIRFKPVVMEPKFVGYFLKSDIYWDAISEYTAGIAVPNVNATKLSNIEVPIPPLKEQRRIVEKLEKLLAKVESAKARLERVPGILKRFRQAVLAAAVSGELTKDWRERNPEVAIPHIPGEDVHISKSDTVANSYPPQWRVVRLGDLVDFVGSGITPRGGKSNYLDAGVPFIRSQNVWPSGLKLDDIVYVSEELHQKMKRTHLKEKDVLLNITGASIGRAAVIPLGFGPANVNQHVCIIRVEQKLIPEFVKLFLNSPIGQDEIFSTQRGVTREGLNYGQIRSLTIPLLSFEEQKEIVRRVEALFKIADQVEARYHKAKARVDNLTQAILAKALRGKLVPQDPNDEPASVLLERIKAEKGHK